MRAVSVLMAGWALALVVLAPTAERLDRRVALNLALTVGWLPATLYLPHVLGTRSAAVVALTVATTGSILAVLVWHRPLVPSIRRRDATMAATGLLAGAVALPLLTPRTPAEALAMLSTGIDNSYHFAMVLEQRLATVGSPLLAAYADGTGFAFADYPQWFHRLLTVLAEVLFGSPGMAPEELVRFAQLQWVVFVVLAVIVVAALLQALPDEVPVSVLVPAVAAVWGLLVGVPGAVNLLQGHLSFLLAASGPLVMALLAVGTVRIGALDLLVLGGLVLVTAAWLLLVPMAGAALLIPGFMVWRRQGRTMRWALLVGVAAAVAGAFVVVVLPWFTTGGYRAVLRDGTVPRVGLPTTAVVLIGGVVLLAVLSRRERNAALGGHALVAGAALVQTAALGAYMLSAAGELTYYFWKLALGALLITTVLLIHAIVVVRGTRAPAARPLRPIAAAALTLVGLLGYGSVLHQFAAPSVVWAGLVPVSLEARQGSGDAGDVDLVLELATTLRPPDAARTRLLATRADDMNPAHASEWFHALSHSATRRAMNVDDGIYDLALDVDDRQLALTLALQTLSTDDGRVVVTDPTLRDAVVAAAGPEAAARVTLMP